MVHAEARTAPPLAVLIVEGVFLQRLELRNYWDLAIFLAVPFEETFRRMAIRDSASADPFTIENSRYRLGQLRYFDECSPERRADVVIDNSNVLHPTMRFNNV